MRLFLLSLPALAILAACAAPPPPMCLMSAEQAAGLASSSSEASDAVLFGDLGAGCVTLPFEYARDPGRTDDGTLVLDASGATLTVTGLATDLNTGAVLNGPGQARMTLTATFAAPPAAGAEAGSASVARRVLVDGAVRELVSEPGAIRATLTAVDLATGRVEGTFGGPVPFVSSRDADRGRPYVEPHFGRFSATVAVTGSP